MASRSSAKRRQLLLGVGFASPWIIGFVTLIGGPILASLYYSFTDFNIFQSPKFVGLANYAEMMDDEIFWKSVANTAYVTVIGLPLGLALALACALALNLDVKGKPLYRAIVYLPSIVPIVVAVYVWRWLLNGEYGYVNWLLGLVGLPEPSWLLDPEWTKPALILMGLWNIGATAIIYLAALQDVPRELYESATVDGAGAFARFRHVTWPVISPIALFQLIIGIIASLQIFMQPYLLAQGQTGRDTAPTSGGPEDSLITYAMYLWQNAFVHFKMGYASAMAWVLFLVTALITWFVLRTSRRWVHHGR